MYRLSRNPGSLKLLQPSGPLQTSIVLALLISLPVIYKIKEGKMGEACNTYGGKERFKQGLGGENWR